jgi:hypothetical protein
MFGKALKNIILLVSFFAVNCFSTNKIYAETGAGQVRTETIADPTLQFPNGELERVQHPSTAGWNITAHRNLASLALSQGTFDRKEQPSLKGSVVKISSLRVKDYLLHIHPYHHFW